MDQISYAHSAKQSRRIKRFIAEPDSTSGLVSLPKVIEAGENITIPDGRVVVHPNLEIDGTLTIENDGELFVPFGGTLASSDLMHPVDTIEDLRNETGKYKYVYVNGYHAKDDGAFGSNMFVWDEYSTETDNGGTIIKCTTVTTGRYKLKYSGAVNVKWFGAKGDGVTDDTVAIQAALDFNQIITLPKGKYRITSSLLVDPIRNRNCGFITDIQPSRYQYTKQEAISWDGLQEAIIFYDGAVNSTAACISASSEAIGVEPKSTFNTTIWGLTLTNITLDANGKAGFGLYTARVQGLQLNNVKARGAKVAGFSINGTYSGSVKSCHAYLNPGRGFELGAADVRWGWTINDKVNALHIYDLHADANGSDSTFRESDALLKTNNCGVYFGAHRGVVAYGVVSENNFGANIVYIASDSGSAINGFYTELGCKYAPSGAGSDAISLGYATKQLGIIFVGSTSSLNNRMSDGVCAIDAIWLTGVEPSATRQEGGFELYNVSLATGGLIADWGNYRLINCALELETIIGTPPVGAMTLKGGLQFGSGQDNLNYYDEGTWTPAFAGITLAGTGWEYSLQAGNFTRIGRQVFITGKVALSAVSTDATGQIAITGLPFTVQNSNVAAGSVQLSNVVNLTTAVVSLDGAVSLNNTRFTLQKRTSAAVSASSVVLADLSNTTTITFSGHYNV